MELILVLRILYGAYSCTKVPIGTTQIHYTEVPIGTTGLILILQNLYLFYRYGSTLRYYIAYTEAPVGTFRSLPYSFFTLILYSDSYHITV